jgi:hypothetical protein
MTKRSGASSPRAGLLAIFTFALATSATAAPIYGDVTLDGGIHLWSDDIFIARGYWTDEMTKDEVLSHPFELPVVFDGKHYRVDWPFPTPLLTCGTFQVDAWWHSGWWGELRPTNQSCSGGTGSGQLPPEFPPEDPPVVPRDPDPPMPVPEPATWLLLASGAVALRLRIARGGGRATTASRPTPKPTASDARVVCVALHRRSRAAQGFPPAR